jgi:hypothetical protein
MGMAPSFDPSNKASIPTQRPTYINPKDAAAAIRVLRAVEDRLPKTPQNALERCIGFAKDAIWAAAYPDDPYSMLNQVADAAADAE